MEKDQPGEFFISVDVETAGPAPSRYSLLAIGACTVVQPHKTFYVELKPVTPDFTPEALASCNLFMEQLAEKGAPPEEALRRFAAWIREVTPSEVKPVFVGFNAPFDWMFVNDYFERFLQQNPFGHAALDIKSYYMGLARTSWAKTTMRHLATRYLDHPTLTHHALRDAIDQAILFHKMLVEAKESKERENGHSDPFQ